MRSMYESPPVQRKRNICVRFLRTLCIDKIISNLNIYSPATDDFFFSQFIFLLVFFFNFISLFRHNFNYEVRIFAFVRNLYSVELGVCCTCGFHLRIGKKKCCQRIRSSCVRMDLSLYIFFSHSVDALVGITVVSRQIITHSQFGLVLFTFHRTAKIRFFISFSVCF